MKPCDSCGRVAYDPNDTSDTNIADLALQKMLEMLKYGEHLEKRFAQLVKQNGQLQAENQSMKADITELQQALVVLATKVGF